MLYEKVLEAISRIKRLLPQKSLINNALAAAQRREKIKKLENPWDSKALLKLSVILL